MDIQYITGRNPVIEVLKNREDVEKVLVLKGELKGSINKIVGIAKDRGTIIQEVNQRFLDDISDGGVHQGVAAVISPFKYSSIDEILDYARSREEDPFVLILDEIEDPHNLGAIARTAECAGVHGIIIPERRSASVNQTVYSSSAGAVEYMKIAKVTNISQSLKKLKEEGLWIYGADMDGESYYRSNLTGSIGLVIGNEGKGISRLVKENCDVILSIPMLGKISSLNASNAASILMYEVVRQNNG